MQETEVRPLTVRPGEAESVDVFGVRIDILATGVDTGGVYSSYEASMEPGFGSPPHVHLRDDESFYVLEGEFEFRRGDEVLRGGPGLFVYLPRGLPHHFRNVGTGRGRLLGTGTPAGHEGFFRDASRLSFPPDPEEALRICQEHGMELLPPQE